jgi:hypothetical protein
MTNKATLKFRRTSDFGDLESFRENPHTGIDYAMPEGTGVETVTDGIIENVVDYGDFGLGKAVVVKMEDGATAIYGHLSEFKVKVGEIVKQGEVIGLSGNTGRSTGPHLHFAVKEDGQFVNPIEFEPNIQAMGDYGIGAKLLDKYNSFADRVIGAQVDYTQENLAALFKPVGGWIKDGFIYLLDLLNYHSPGIIALGLVICGGGMMLGSITGHAQNWTSKMFIVLWGGIIWRVLI